MKYYVFVANTPYAENEYYLKIEEDKIQDLEALLNEYAEEFAHENAEDFEYLATGWYDDFETEEDRENYYNDCYCNYEEITKEEYEANT